MSKRNRNREPVDVTIQSPVPVDVCAWPAWMTPDQRFEANMLHKMHTKDKLVEMYMRVKSELERIQLDILNAEFEYDRAIHQSRLGPLTRR